MTETETPAQGAAPKRALSEDWLATIIGLVIVLIIGLGLLGPGPQSAKLSAPAGEYATTHIAPRTDWKINATLGGEAADFVLTYPDEAAARYTYVCRDGTISTGDAAELPEDIAEPQADMAQLVLINACDNDIAITYKTNYAIPWPLFGLFAR